MRKEQQQDIQAEGGYAVIFTSVRAAADDEAYAETVRRLAALAEGQPGFLGMESVRGGDGRGITVSYWKDRASIEAWKRQPEHAQARSRGRDGWYERFTVRICKVEKEYGFS